MPFLGHQGPPTYPPPVGRVIEQEDGTLRLARCIPEGSGVVCMVYDIILKYPPGVVVSIRDHAGCGLGDLVCDDEVFQSSLWNGVPEWGHAEDMLWEDETARCVAESYFVHDKLRHELVVNLYPERMLANGLKYLGLPEHP